MQHPVNTTKFGELTCRVVNEVDDETPRALVVLSHGFGAPGTDLVTMSHPFIEKIPQITKGIQFIFPEAPMDLAPLGMPGGRAWWPINMAELAAMHQTNDFSKLTEIEPEGLREASAMLTDAIQAMLTEKGLSEDRLLLGGFSQGAMVSTDVVLRTGVNPAGLILMSGTILCRKDWTRMAGEHPGCQVVQTHGTMDMLLPVEASTWLRDMLSDNGFTVNYRNFVGPHTVPPEAYQMIAELLVGLSS